jgi:hypothetical protein
MRYFWNPFYKLAGWKALIPGLIALAFLGLFGGYFDAHFDGVIDMHVAKEVTYGIAFLENIINWLVLVVVWGIAAIILNGYRFRSIDLIGIMGFVRIPYIVLPPLAYLFSIKDIIDNITAMAFDQSEFSLEPLASFGFVAFVILSLALIILSVIWMYNGFKLLSNSKGVRLNVTFIIGLIICELLSKVIIGIILL